MIKIYFSFDISLKETGEKAMIFFVCT